MITSMIYSQLACKCQPAVISTQTNISRRRKCKNWKKKIKRERERDKEGKWKSEIIIIIYTSESSSKTLSNIYIKRASISEEFYYERMREVNYSHKIKS